MAENWPDILSNTVGIVALIVSIISWKRSRVIYAIETRVLRQPRGGHEDLRDEKAVINADLSSGRYTILAVAERQDKDWELVLGRIEK